MKEGGFSNPFVQQMAKEHLAWKWWMMNVVDSCQTLRLLSIKLLAQCASNSSSERNWSTYKYIHSTIHNRLLADRVEKLVYVFCNEKILNILESEDYEEGMPIWMYNCSDKEDNELENTMENNEDDNEVASERTKIAMNLALEEESGADDILRQISRSHTDFKFDDD